MITPGNDGVYIDIQVQPRARHPGVLGVHGDRLKIAVNVPAEHGKANQASVEAVADLFDVPVGAVSLVSGRTSRRKRLFVRGIDVVTAQRATARAIGDR